jgi:Ca2+-binding RTX toxin-like protein
LDFACPATMLLVFTHDVLVRTTSFAIANEFGSRLDTGANNLYGNSDDDSLTGAAGKDQLHGGDGTDTVFGYGAADSLNGGASTDPCNGGTGSSDTAVDCETLVAIP